MPWRSPAEKASRAKPPTKTAQSKSQSKTSQSPKSSAGALAALVSQDERLKLDRETGTAQLDLNVQFESGTASLTAADRQQLDEVVKLLKSDDAADLRVMVSGFAAGKPVAVEGEAGSRIASPRQLAAARAQAVADYLDSHGIAGERLAVSGTGARAKLSAESEQLAGGVALHLLPPDMPVVGWGSGDATLRR
jgi:outer membrane protein OmpA-like peptidoglycan-associated protein